MRLGEVVGYFARRHSGLSLGLKGSSLSRGLDLWNATCLCEPRRCSLAYSAADDAFHRGCNCGVLGPHAHFVEGATCSSGRGSTYCAYSGSQSTRAALIAGHRRGSLVIFEAMLLTLLLDPHSFFPPGFWQIAAILLVTVAVIIWLVVDLVRRLWRSENQLARLGGRLVVLVLVIAIMYFWIGPMQLRL
jgi:hypothetical protein